MTVAYLISNPINEIEANFSFPIAFRYLINRITFILTEFTEIEAMRKDIIIWIG